MKRSIKYLALIVTVSFTILVGCSDFFDEVEDVDVGVTNAFFEQSAVIELKDYFGDQENLINTDLQVEFSGADADKLVNEAGEFAISETDGFIQLNVNPNKSIGVKELNFDVTISGGNYITETFPVVLKDTISHVQLALVDDSKINRNTDEATKAVDLSNNTVSTDVVVKTAIDNSFNSTEVLVNTGTQFKDAAGVFITGSSVNIVVNNTDQYSDLELVSESMTFSDETGAIIGDKSADLIFGITNISMDVDGTAVKEFTKAIDVAINIGSNTINPFTGVEVISGDTFPIYTKDDEAIEWTYHGIGTVVEDIETNTFNIVFNTTHLSDYAIAKFVDVDCRSYGNNITSTNLPSYLTTSFVIQFRTGVKTTDLGNPISVSYQEEFIDLFTIDIKNGQVTEVKSWTNMFDNKVVKPGLPNYYQGYRGYFRYVIEIILKKNEGFFIDNPISTFDGIGYRTIQQDYQLLLKSNGITYRTNLSDIATIVDCEFTANLSQDLTQYINIDNLKNINVEVASSCNGSPFVPDGFPLYVERENGQFSYEGTIKKGKMTLNGFELGKEYNFKTIYKGKSYTHKWTFDKVDFIDNDYKAPDEVCSVLGI